MPGVPLIDGGTVRLPALIGLSHALDMILTGRPVHAREALKIGKVQVILNELFIGLSTHRSGKQGCW